MLRKNKCFLDGANMVESQIIYTEPHTEDIRHRRRIPEQPHSSVYFRLEKNITISIIINRLRSDLLEQTSQFKVDGV